MLKNIFYKRETVNNITSKRILFWETKYVKDRMYKHFVDLLKYIAPCSKRDLSSYINELEKISKKSKISLKQYLSDYSKIEKILKEVNSSELPKNNEKLKAIQKTELDFVKEVIYDIYKNTNLKPFMDYGTLLGAVRHKGFIPWDDDVDFGIMRSDFEKLIEYLSNKYIFIDNADWEIDKFKFSKNYIKDIYEKYENQIVCFRTISAFKVYKCSKDSYQVLDFFPLDYYNNDFNVQTLQKYINKVKETIENLNFKTLGKLHEFYKNEIQKADIFGGECIHGGVDNYGSYYYSVKNIRRKEDIFPLKMMQFEDAQFYAPNNPHEYLKAIYNNYNCMPVVFEVALHQKEKITLTN